MSFMFKSDLKFTEHDAERIVVKSLDHLKTVLGKFDTDILLCSSGRGIITLEAAKSKISNILNGHGRITITSLASEVDIDRAIAMQQVHILISETPYDLYIQGETIFTKGELEIITNNLQNAILENKVLASVDFGYTQRIDPLLLKRIVDRLNRKTQNDPNIIILDDMIISEPALAASKQAFFDLLNESKTPLNLSALELDEILFQDSNVRSIILKALPKAIKEGLVKGAVEKDQTFVPEALTLQLQKNQIIALEKNGIVKLSQLARVSIKNVDDYLTQHLGNENPFTILAEHVILKSYSVNIATEIEGAIRKDGFVDLGSLTFFGVSNDSPDRITISQTSIRLANEMLSDIVIQSIYLQEPEKKNRKTILPNYLVTQDLLTEIKTTVEDVLITPLARSNASQAISNSEIFAFIEDDNLMRDELLRMLPQFDQRTITGYLLEKFNRKHTDSKALSPQLLRYFGTKLGPELIEIYESTLMGETHSLFNKGKKDALILLLINLRGILDISITEKKLAAKFYVEFQDTLYDQAKGPLYVPLETANLDMEDLEKYLISEIENQEMEISLEEALSARQEIIIKGLERALKRITDINEASYALHLATVIIHAKILRLDGQYGTLNITGKYAPKVLKNLEKRLDVGELLSLLHALKKKEVTLETLNSAKELAINL